MRLIIRLLLGGVLNLFGTAQASQQMIIPAYFYPGSLWAQAVSGAPTVSAMVMNPYNGPETAPNPDYVTAVQQARAAGVAVLGYVHTSYGARPAATVQADIDAYFAWYDVDGIFLDEVASSATWISYYDSLSGYIRQWQGAAVVMNPGTYPDEGYVALADVLLVFESTYLKYQSSVTPAWVYKYAPERFYHIVYETPEETAMLQAVQWARERNAGYVYVTDDVLDNPFDTLPGFWTSELAELGGGAVPNQAPVLPPISDQSMWANATLAVGFSVSDAETPPDSLLLWATASDPARVPEAGRVVARAGSDRTLFITPAASTTGTATITVYASDGVAVAAESFQLSVIASKRKGKRWR